MQCAIPSSGAARGCRSRRNPIDAQSRRSRRPGRSQRTGWGCKHSIIDPPAAIVKGFSVAPARQSPKGFQSPFVPALFRLVGPFPAFGPVALLALFDHLRPSIPSFPFFPFLPSLRPPLAPPRPFRPSARPSPRRPRLPPPSPPHRPLLPPRRRLFRWHPPAACPILMGRVCQTRRSSPRLHENRSMLHPSPRSSSTARFPS
jgi:hypothetical protein